MANNFRGQCSSTTEMPYLISDRYKTPPIFNMCSEICRTIFRFIGWVIVAAAVSCFLYLLYHVRASYMVHASQFDINSFSMSTFGVNTSQRITANWTINFSISKNPMKKSLSYKNIDISLLYRDVLVLKTKPAPFQQRRGNDASLKVTFATSPAAMLDGRVAEAISHKRLNDTMAFNVEVNTKVKAEKWKKFKLRINCPQIKVRFASNNRAEMLPDDSVRPYCHYKLYGIIWF